MAKYVSGRQKNLKVGISSYSENLTSLEVIGNVGIATTNATSRLYVVGDGYFTGIVTASNFSVGNSLVGAAGSFSQLNVSGITTLGVTSATNLTAQQLNVSGISTLGITSTTNLTSQQLNVSGITTLGVTSATNLTSRQLNVSGITTLGITSTTNLTSQQLNVSGISTLGVVTSGNIYSTGIVTATQFSTGSGTLGFTTNTINGPSEIIIDPSPVGVGTTSGAVRIKGDLYVDGTQFIVNSTTIELADFNVGIATTVGTNALLDGAGIGIGSANIRKTFTYSSSPSDSLKSSENLDIASGKVYKIAGTEVLSSTQLTVANINATGISTLGVTSTTNLTSQQLNVSGISTIQSTTLIGGGTSTGTAGQVLQVAGINSSVYIGGNLGIGTTNSTSKLYVVGDEYVTGVVTATAFYGTFSGNAATATYATNAGVATYATNAGISTYATNAGVATYATNAGVATYATNAGIATYAPNAGIATYASRAGIATYATTSGVSTNVIGGIASVTSLSVSGITTLGVVTAGNIYSTGIITATTINFASGGVLGDLYSDGGIGIGLKASPANYYAVVASNNLQQFLQVDDNQIFITTGYASTTGTYDWKFDKNGALTFPDNTIQYTAFTGYASTAGIATYASAAGIATYAPNAGVATYAPNAGIATYAPNAGIATYATNAGIATYATSAGIATYATNAGIATYATNAGIATYATNAGISTNVIGGIASVTQLQVTGVSTFTNGPVLVGTTTATGTASQPLQVTGGAYVSGSIGIGTTNPQFKLDVNGDINFNGTFYQNGSQFVASRWASGTGDNIYRLNGNVGVGTTNPTVPLSVIGNANFTGVVTASSFSGNASSSTYATNAGIATYATSAGIATYATNAGIATNLKGGLVGNIPYQSGSDTTVFLTNGGSGTILQSNGPGATPSWITPAPAGAITGLTIRDENQVVGGANSVSTLNFVGNIVSVASTAGIATITFLDYVSNAGVSTSVIGGIGSITQLQVTGISTFSNGPVFIGAATSTGTASQPLQVTGGAYVSDNLGIGTTNPTSKLYVVGDGYFTGILTANRIISSVYGEFVGGSISGTNIVGTALSITGISTFSNGPVFIGAATSTGTASQPLQVTGGAYVSDNLGIGTANPTSKLYVVGDGYFTGVVTATSFSGFGTNLTGIVTSIVAGTNITVSDSTGQVTINAAGGLDILEVMLFA